MRIVINKRALFGSYTFLDSPLLTKIPYIRTKEYCSSKNWLKSELMNPVVDTFVVGKVGVDKWRTKNLTKSSTTLFL
jgi:hypothetical protein